MKVELLKDGKVDVIVVTIPVTKRPSKSGKTVVVASTHGNQPTGLMIDGKPVILGLNAYVK